MSNSCNKNIMTVSIRPHHLLCMLTFLGKGYTKNFVDNYNVIIRRLNSGEDILLVDGPDDICQPMLCEEGCHCENESVRTRDEQAAREISKVLRLQLTCGSGLTLTAAQISLLRDAFVSSAIRTACAGCEWHDLCSGIAGNKFRGCRLAPPD